MRVCANEIARLRLNVGFVAASGSELEGAGIPFDEDVGKTGRPEDFLRGIRVAIAARDRRESGRGVEREA